MSREITITCGLSIRKLNTAGTLTLLEHRSVPTGFTADMTGAKGPVPGAIAIAITGTDVDFSQLSTPGWVWMRNLDPTNFVEWGIKEPATGFFYPIGILRPGGPPALFEFSPNLLEEYTGTGTGTSAPTNKFHLKANVAACNVVVAAFEQ